MTASISRAITLRRCEFGVAKDGSENPLGQQVLNEHLLNSGFGEVGVDRLTAFLMECGKGSGKFPIRPPFLFDQFLPSRSQARALCL